MASEKCIHAEIYPDSALLNNSRRVDVINPATLNGIPELFSERIRCSPEDVAYLQYMDDKWQEFCWREVGEQLARWRAAFIADGLVAGERVAIRLKNSLSWMLYDQGAMGAGLVVVPVFAEDRADNIAYIVESTEARVLLVETLDDWLDVAEHGNEVDSLKRVVLLSRAGEGDLESALKSDSRLILLEDWLAAGEGCVVPSVEFDIDSLATIVFTSGTTGKPKGVMLSHRNILLNAYAGARSVAIFPEDRMLSFLPLSHMFERTIGYYLNVMAGASVAFNRSIPELLDDIAVIKPTVLITVPRIFERAYNSIKEQLDAGSALSRWMFSLAVNIGWQRFEMQQGRAYWTLSQLLWPLTNKLVGAKVRAKFGGHLRFVVSGGAPLSAKISKVFIGLGINILQGYGLTETSPVLTVNTLERSQPDSIGLPLADTELRVAPDGELQAKGSAIMMGYWQNEEATKGTMMEDGWLQTGDIATIAESGFISITGRIKEIIVLANGEKVPPSDMEAAICDEAVFEQAMILGEGKSFLSAVVVLNREGLAKVVSELNLDQINENNLDDEALRAWGVARIAQLVEDFPGYANVRKVLFTLAPWTVEDGALTPTMKIKRPIIQKRFDAKIAEMYEGH